MAGRPRIAREIHQQSGAYKAQPTRENKDSPLADGQEPEMPEYFNEDEQGKWHELLRDLRQNGIISWDNREILVAYCTAYGQWISARRMVMQLGAVLVRRDDNGKVVMEKSPYNEIMNEARRQMNKLLPEFGLTPASRQRLVSFKPKEDDPFEAWLAGASVSKN